MTIVIKGPLTTEKVEKAIETFNKETEIKRRKKKFWLLKIGTAVKKYQKLAASIVV